jgi:hypothetical protein
MVQFSLVSASSTLPMMIRRSYTVIIALWKIVVLELLFSAGGCCCFTQS